MITGFKIQNLGYISQGVLDLPLLAPGMGLKVLRVEGLTPVNSTISTMDRALRAGSDVLGARPQSRNLVFTIGYDLRAAGDKSISDLRDLSYRYFSNGAHLRITVESTNKEDVYTHGYVESVEANIFGTDPLLQISILCPESYFEAVEPITTSYGLDPGLYYIRNYTHTQNNELGFRVKMTKRGSSSLSTKKTITQLIDGNLIRDVELDFSGVSNLEEIIYDSTPGRKTLEQRTPSGTERRIDLLDVGDSWITILPGVNRIEIRTQAQGCNIETQITRRYNGL